VGLLALLAALETFEVLVEAGVLFHLKVLILNLLVLPPPLHRAKEALRRPQVKARHLPLQAALQDKVLAYSPVMGEDDTMEAAQQVLIQRVRDHR